ncbi:glycine/D-amino acid oxidase-like deaminating enzyme [Rhodopseudomonas julia]|uniref:Glycine/D-amino acid oxidase-like deaminating enzyme n=1 Tax=Rhodopseudomonas julia TaxID=200617 RepID=A0ABU0C155_9BRAD|nr:FAD-binding oxidoreductase [Rhodopseudomonas julia]MDQ0324254.1 glycine/D-amino acid oxidase-like deaminating enzyme [Rhodopseudomonas julia]
MGPQVDPVVSDRAFPEKADVVVIGGGIIGVSSALFMAERGMDVVVVEKGHIAGEQSSRNWGWVRQLYRDPREFDLIREALGLWRGLDQRIGGETGFTQCGILYGARNDKDVQAYRAWAEKAAASGIVTELLSGREMEKYLPGDQDLPKAILLCPGDGRAEPQKAAPAIALGARARGARIFTDCAARGIETAAGEVAGVVTERGRIATKNVVVAGGAWSRRILSDLDIVLPQLKVRASVARTSPVEGGPEVSIWDDVLGLRKRADGGYTLANGLSNAAPLTPDSFRFFFDFLPVLAMDWRHVGLRLDERFFSEWRERKPVPYDQPSPYEACRVLDPKPDLGYVRKCFEEAKRRFPVFNDARLVQTWAGFIDTTPDVVPVISPVESCSGLIIATGFSGHGFGIGPGAGHLVADLVTGEKPIADPHAFRLSRFSDGSRPRPMTNL